MTAALLIVTLATAAEPPLEAAQLSRVERVTMQLIHELDYLQKDIAADVTEKKERELFRKSEGVILMADKFALALTPDTSRAALAKQFDALDEQLQQLLKAVGELGPTQRAVQRSAGRVRALQDELHYALFVGDRSAERTETVIRRQVAVLLGAAQELERSAAFALANRPSRGTLEADLKKFTGLVQRLQTSVSSGSDKQQLQRDFAAVNGAWEAIVRQLQDLPPAENVYLLRGAGKVDQCHEHLYRLLNVEGKRKGLILRT
ncbi:MAG: hypothetical protein K2R98_27790 [Gemmataceae bacterium]|nr:hypothetical protein [Gemmataceae bacterium]